MRYDFAKKVGLGFMLATVTVSSAMPAQAQRRDGWSQRDRGDWDRRDRHRRRNNDSRVAGAVVGGVLALGIGAAIASSVSDHNRRRDYDERLRDQDYYPSQAPYGAPQPGYEPYYPPR